MGRIRPIVVSYLLCGQGLHLGILRRCGVTALWRLRVYGRWYDDVVSDFCTKERDPKGWTVVAGGSFFVLLAVFGLGTALASPGDYAAVGRKIEIGSVGGFLISAIVVAGLSWLLVLGLRSIIQRRPVRWEGIGPLMVVGMAGSPSSLLKDLPQNIWFRIGVALVAGVFLSFAMPWLDDHKQPNMDGPTKTANE